MCASSAPQHPLQQSPSSQQSLAGVQGHPSLSVPCGSCPASRQDPAPASRLTAGPVITSLLPGSQHHPQRIMEIPEVRFCSVSLSQASCRAPSCWISSWAQLLTFQATSLSSAVPCPSWPLSPPDGSLRIFSRISAGSKSHGAGDKAKRAQIVKGNWEINLGLAQCSTGESWVCQKNLGILGNNNVQIPFVCLRVFLGLFSFSDSNTDCFGDDSQIVLSCWT